MRSSFACRLAVSNVRQNRKFYLPYILASIGMIMMFYIVAYLASSKDLSKMPGAEYITFLMDIGVVMIGVFAVIFLFYINNFLMKRRMREIGLYNVLGMEKKHIGKILFIENFITSVISIAAGILLGIVFSKLVHMILAKIMGFDLPIHFRISGFAIAVTALLFGVIFLLVLLKNQMKIHLANPVELLRGSNAGENEPKVRHILTVIGIICLGSGYVMAVAVKDPLHAVLLFMIAVFLVIAGTYLLFTTVSIAILKRLQKSKKYYYTPSHFTAVSGMLYRMKQNAVGMANICILSTMVLVMVSTTMCLNSAVTGIIDQATPKDIIVSGMRSSYSSADSQYTVKEAEKIIGALKSSGEKHGVTISGIEYYRICTVKNSNDMCSLISSADYEKITGKKIDLQDDEVLAGGKLKLGSSNTLYGHALKIKEQKNDLGLGGTVAGINEAVLVGNENGVLKDVIRDAQKSGNVSSSQIIILCDSNGSLEQNKAVTEELNSGAGIVKATYFNANYREEVSNQFYGFTGGFLFLGIFLGIVFTFAAALIIYYKQISEGYYDKEKFEIFRKVGMSREEMKKSIRSQVLLVFFAPLAVAAVHVGFAFNIVYRMLTLFSISNIRLFFNCTLVTFAIFTAIYAFVYAVTSREYYKIVK